MGKTTKIRLTEEEAREQEEANRPKEPIKLTPKQQEQLAFRTGSRRERRRIAKRNGFFKDRSGTAWREANRMIRDNDSEVRL